MQLLLWLAACIVTCVTADSWFTSLFRGFSQQTKLRGFPLPPDTRPGTCPQSYEAVDLGYNTTVSIIIPYLREKKEHIEKTMKSILYFTEDKLIHEFILISDGNPPEYTYEKALLALSPKVKVVKNEERMGLIKAKMKAVAMARAPVLVFMEAHCIVNRAWLEPLLARLVEYPRALVQPTLDVIPQDNFGKYYKGARGHWRFEWNMNLIFTVPPDPGELEMMDSRPSPSPATSGGIFAIRRDWWNRLGFYDPEMLEWGGDHVEATMKVWRCGGHIDLHPCSRVGHLFRDPAHRPYNVEVPVVIHNYGRLALVWWDSYLAKFYQMKPEARSMATGDVSAQKKLKEELECKDMAWYIHWVDPEMEWEADHLCIPGAAVRLGGCERAKIEGRSTIDRTIPSELYRKRRAEIREYFEVLEARASHEL